MKKLIVMILFGINFAKNCYSQGLIFDSMSFSQQKEFPTERSSLPSQTNLEKYLPILYPQTGATCVAMSLSLARTILYAEQYRITDRKAITVNQMSPYFIYYHGRNKYDYECKNGMNPIDALNIAKQIGFEKLMNIEYPNYWPFTSNFLCPNIIDFIPPEHETHMQNAKKYKIDDFLVTKSIIGIKTALSKGLPVILAMQVPESFESAKSNFWKSFKHENRTLASGHAMVAIGYNDNLYGGAIYIANSWGDNWGNDGKIWINYNELQYWLDGGFVIFPSITNYGEQNDKIPNLKSQNYSNFKSKDFNGKFEFNNKKIIDAFNNN